MFVSITRLHVRALRYLPEFAVQALRSALEAKAAPGNVAISLLADARRTFWTRTIWIDEAAMRAFMRMSAHRVAMGKLARWCDQAALVHWTQQDAKPPSWDEAWQRMRGVGRPSPIDHPAAAHVNFEIAAPKVGRFGELRFK